MIKKNILFIISALLLFFVLLGTGLFNYQCQQIKNKLAIEIKENKNLLKKINELQKEIEELKIFEDEKTINKITDWKTYKNEQQGFEIKLPPAGEWDYDIRIDRIDEQTGVTSFDGQFNVLGEENNINFWMRANLYAESNLPLYVFETVCKSEREAVFLNNQISYATYSTLDLERKNLQDCDSALDEFILDKHESETKFCLDKSSETIYLAKSAIMGDPSIGGEYGFSCDINQDLYYFQLSCQGNEWKGREGQDKCSQLFNQILSTFRFIE